MKALLTAILCCTLVSAMQAQENEVNSKTPASMLNPDYTAQPKQMCGIVLALFVVAAVAGAWYGIHVLYSGPPQDQPVDLMLLSSTDCGISWRTNQVLYSVYLGFSNPIDLFHVEEDGSGQMAIIYKIKVIRTP